MGRIPENPLLQLHLTTNDEQQATTIATPQTRIINHNTVNNDEIRQHNEFRQHPHRPPTNFNNTTTDHHRQPQHSESPQHHHTQ
ncbi:unnamed protein product [Ilex paraguariensis]|uniref:Uncharacterized protein n=1 Tax=Ilex paraguariensis TaxID=185542 RepID=A0ABC8T953_9AQUA